jgi:hypothetical protein
MDQSPVKVTRVAATRWARRLAGSPPSVLMTATGPPHLPLVDRGPLLRQIREHIDAADMRPDLALVGNWRRRVVAQGSAVLDILFEDEEQADARGMWWTHDVRWSDTEGRTHLLYEVDDDGHDLVFLSWGPRAAAISDVLKRLLEGPPPEV